MSGASSLVIENLRGPLVGPVSLTVPGGTCAAITGPSGAGKSLLLRLIADLDPGEGDVRLGALRRAATSAPHWRRQVVYVPAEAGWWGACAGAHFPSDGMAAATAEAVRLGLPPDWSGRPVATLSTGERQRLALLRALIHKPRALLLDEPTSGLDAESVGRVEDLLRAQLAAGLVLVVVSHDAAQAARLGTTRYAMSCGRLTAA